MRRLSKIPAHQWVVIIVSGFIVVSSVWTALVQGNVGGAVGGLIVGFLILGAFSWAYVAKREGSDDPDSYGLGKFWRDSGEGP